MFPRKAVERIQEREKKRIEKLIDVKISHLQKLINNENKNSEVNWLWVESWQSAIKSLEELQREL